MDASGGTWAAPTVANRNRIKAIRIAVVARNAKIGARRRDGRMQLHDRGRADRRCARGHGSAASPAPTIDLSPGDANWARYRYRVFETIIPLRNVIWSKDTL